MSKGRSAVDFIAPCGMNCGICKSYLAFSRGIPAERGKVTHCSGCLPRNRNCYIKRGCKKLLKNEIKFCFECETIPCKNLDWLDQRYRERHSMSMIENLQELKERHEKVPWSTRSEVQMPTMQRRYLYSWRWMLRARYFELAISAKPWCIASAMLRESFEYWKRLQKYWFPSELSKTWRVKADNSSSSFSSIYAQARGIKHLSNFKVESQMGSAR